MKKILKTSVDVATSLLPKAKDARRTKNKFFHFCFGFHGNKLIAIGQNNPEQTNAKAYHMRQRFNVDARYPYIHAEVDMLSKLWGKYYIDNNLKVVVLRLNKQGILRNSKPCEKCSAILQALDIDKLWWSIDDGFQK
jgi:hypothetical protein